MHRRISVANAEEGALESSSLLRLQSRVADIERQMEVIRGEIGANNDETSDRFAAIDTHNKYTKYTFTNLSPVTAASSQAPATLLADHDLGLWELLQ